MARARIWTALVEALTPLLNIYLYMKHQVLELWVFESCLGKCRQTYQRCLLRDLMIFPGNRAPSVFSWLLPFGVARRLQACGAPLRSSAPHGGDTRAQGQRVAESAGSARTLQQSKCWTPREGTGVWGSSSSLRVRRCCVVAVVDNATSRTCRCILLSRIPTFGSTESAGGG